MRPPHDSEDSQMWPPVTSGDSLRAFLTQVQNPLWVNSRGLEPMDEEGPLYCSDLCTYGEENKCHDRTQLFPHCCFGWSTSGERAVLQCESTCFESTKSWVQIQAAPGWGKVTYKDPRKLLPNPCTAWQNKGLTLYEAASGGPVQCCLSWGCSPWEFSDFALTTTLLQKKMHKEMNAGRRYKMEVWNGNIKVMVCFCTLELP